MKLLPWEEPEVLYNASHLVELKDALQKFFYAENSGVEDGLRSKQCVFNFLTTVALVIELGNLFGVIEKAEQCAKQGRTLLVYGVANSQMNPTLGNQLMAGLRCYLNNLSVIAEARYEAKMQPKSDRC